MEIVPLKHHEVVYFTHADSRITNNVLFCKNVLKELFKLIDTDNSGTITFDELKEGLRRVGSELMESEIKDLMNALREYVDDTKDYNKRLLEWNSIAAKIQLKCLAKEMQPISKGLEKVSEELLMAENDGAVSETFWKRPVFSHRQTICRCLKGQEREGLEDSML
ncbi:calcium-dependent protein kinase SK5-like protein [Tanacetum coccineum]